MARIGIGINREPPATVNPLTLARIFRSRFRLWFGLRFRTQ